MALDQRIRGGNLVGPRASARRWLAAGLIAQLAAASAAQGARRTLRGYCYSSGCPFLLESALYTGVLRGGPCKLRVGFRLQSKPARILVLAALHRDLGVRASLSCALRSSAGAATSPAGCACATMARAAAIRTRADRGGSARREGKARNEEKSAAKANFLTARSFCELINAGTCYTARLQAGSSKRRTRGARGACRSLAPYRNHAWHYAAFAGLPGSLLSRAGRGAAPGDDSRRRGRIQPA